MNPSTCRNCRLLTRSRFRRRLTDLQNGRRRLSSTPRNFELEVTGSWYWDTVTPTKENLAAASYFFQKHIGTRLWTDKQWKDAELWRSIGKSSDQNQKFLVPEVAFLGRSNAGKSSLMNALALDSLNRTSATPGMTKVMSAWSFAAQDEHGGAIKGFDGDVFPKLSLVDMPGYGFGSQAEWGEQIVKYMNKRRNLRRAFLLIDSSHGIASSDRYMFDIFLQLGIPFQLIATKCDRMKDRGALQDALQKMKEDALNASSGTSLMQGEILATGSLARKIFRARTPDQEAVGIGNVQWAILKAADLEWYAMDKAAQHRVISKSAAKRPVTPNVEQPDISHLLQREETKTEDLSTAATTISSPSWDINTEVSNMIQAKDPQTAVPPKPDGTASSSSSDELSSNLTLEEFMREIWGPGNQGAIGPMSSQYQPTKNKARVFETLTPGGSKQKGPLSVDEQLNTACEELQSYIDGEPGDWNTPASFSPSTRESLTSPPSGKDDSGGSDILDAARAEIDPSCTQFWRRANTKSSTAAASWLPMPSNTSSQPQPSAVAGKGMTQGSDTFDAMFDDPFTAPPPPAPPKQSAATRKGASRGSGAFEGMFSDRSTASRRAPPQRQSTAIAAKGVSQGIDAFDAMFADERDDTPSGGGRKKRKSKSKSSAAAAAASEAGEAPTASPPPAQRKSAQVQGKGVAQGFDAFEALFGESDTVKSKQKQKSKSKMPSPKPPQQPARPATPSTPRARSHAWIPPPLPLSSINPALAAKDSADADVFESMMSEMDKHMSSADSRLRRKRMAHDAYASRAAAVEPRVAKAGAGAGAARSPSAARTIDEFRAMLAQPAKLRGYREEDM